ncbi:MAG TPA: sigma-70 family RNA polymerase sigma factor [Chitinophagaceae bacterium]|nr:sigma-70 family RNA polymerase sigma factor [Chitinophagaceae bacterium]
MQQQNSYYKSLFPYAYNILGSVEEAKDVVGEVLAKHFAHAAAHEISSEKAYLIKSVIHLAISTKTCQKKTLREGEVWLPEPIATTDAADYHLNLTEILSYSLLVLLERLTPAERAVFILRESFDYSHEEIAMALSLSESNARQLLRRAKAKLYKPEVRKKVQNDKQEEILQQFLHAIRERDTRSLEEMLATDIQFNIDGGGRVPFVQGQCSGSAQVAALEMTVYQRYLFRAYWQYVVVNHQPAFLSYIGNQLMSCQIFDVHASTGKILQIHAMLDPQKLKLLSSL